MEIRKLKRKLKEDDGSTVIGVAVLFFVSMLLFSVAYEYLRIQIISYNLRDSFENAIKTVASENYNEVYAGFRESVAVGGQYEGGPEGASNDESNDESEPEWVPLNDYGAVEQELEDLLGISNLTASDGSYALKDIETKVRNADDSSYERYEVSGTMLATIPIKLIGITLKVKIPINVETVYDIKY